jgi:thiol-disulfide isomerase/thioredoxin
MVNFPFYQGKIYLEPGKKTFHLIDGSNKDKPTFMGELSWKNESLNILDSFTPNESKFNDETLKFSIEEYKQYCLAQNREIAHKIDSLATAGIVSSEIAELVKINIQLNLYRQILNYSSIREFTYRQKNNIPWNKEITLEKKSLTSSDLDFIKAVNFNNLSNLSVPEYFMFKYNLLYSEDNRQKMNRIPILEVKEQLKKANVELTTDDYKNLSEIDSIQNLYTISRMDYQKYVGPFMKKFDKYLSNFFSQQRLIIISEYINGTLNINSSLLNDIIKSEYSINEINNSYKPYSQTELDSVLKNISNKFVASYIQYKNTELKNKIDANKSKNGFIVNETPKYEGNKVFEAIIEKYKGKVIYVDFWATWCAPCREGIKNIAPLKEELAEKDIVFLYITGDLSPEGAWKSAIPDIKGEHYRVTDEEWNFLSQEFKIQGIPHYALVDKSGNIINPQLGHMSNENLKKLLLDKI